MYSVQHEAESEWLPISDLMSGLMVIFLFFSILYVKEGEEQKQQIVKSRETVTNQLGTVITPHLPEWNAQWIDSTLTVRFSSDQAVLFEKGEATLSPFFKNNLDAFLPIYLNTIRGDEWKDRIAEVKNNGYTSNEGDFLANIQLSQSRATAVLTHVMDSKVITTNDKKWLQAITTANGLGNKSIIKDEHGVEIKEKSRRVDFTIRLKRTK